VWQQWRGGGINVCGNNGNLLWRGCSVAKSMAAACGGETMWQRMYQWQLALVSTALAATQYRK